MRQTDVFITLTALAALVLAGCATTDVDRRRLGNELKDELKQELKREILAELREELRADTLAQQAAREDQQRIKQELEREILAKLGQQGQAAPPQAPVSVGPVGSAEGRILASGDGLPGCNVKLVRLQKSGLIGEAFSSYVEAQEFVNATDEQGWYRFENLPVGEYKLKWQLPDDTGWIRRIRDDPDVTIRQGETSLLKEIDARKPLLPR